MIPLVIFAKKIKFLINLHEFVNVISALRKIHKGSVKNATTTIKNVSLPVPRAPTLMKICYLVKKLSMPMRNTPVYFIFVGLLLVL